MQLINDLIYQWNRSHYSMDMNKDFYGGIVYGVRREKIRIGKIVLQVSKKTVWTKWEIIFVTSGISYGRFQRAEVV